MLYTLTGAASGTVHVTATSSPARWDRFDAVRASLGSVSAHELPAEPLVRIRGRAYQGNTVRVLAHSADVPWGWQGPMSLLDTDDRPAPEQTSQTLTGILRACAGDYAARSDFPSLQHAARRHDTPQLLKWLDAMISHAERTQTRWLDEAEAHRTQATRRSGRVVDAGPLVHRPPAPDAPDRESLAHRAEYLPSRDSRGAAAEEGRRLTLFRSQYEGLTRPAAASESEERAYFVIGRWRGGGDFDSWHVEEAPRRSGEWADVHEQRQEDAEGIFGSVNVVYAASPQAAADQARREAREISDRIHRERTRP
ncbi:hypothetical protein GCM10014715_82950 [Streptomyces spiralis]|uniref:Uncharacterized protein n=1 Tax=Streptomyces spiralis TaxID=66376 RepID=A0A919E578_9ACTN|nr:hypothetical protein GCM10014715_82950 [Streptomyces spiralis]